MEASDNALVLTSPSESGLSVQLHPLVLLTISDYVTRHQLRGQTGPMVGALIGQQRGTEITLEHAFESNVETSDSGEVTLLQPWFDERLKQFKDVHQSPALDLVGWFTATDPYGPTIQQLPIHRQLLTSHNDNALLLGFHASSFSQGSHTGGKLPLTIYESVIGGTAREDGGKAMDIDGQEGRSDLLFRELAYSVETGEAEMIAMDFVARGGGNATMTTIAVPGHGAFGDLKAKQSAMAKGKAKEGSSETEDAEIRGEPSLEESLLPEEQDKIATLTARLNSVTMLQSRLKILHEFLSSLPPSYLSTPPASPSQPLSYEHIREIYGLLSNLNISPPPTTSAESPLDNETLALENEVALLQLISQMGSNLQAVSDVGKKWQVIEQARKDSARGSQGHGMTRYGEEDPSVGGRMGRMGPMAGMIGLGGRKGRRSAAGDLME